MAVASYRNVQAFCWMADMMSLASASLDSKVVIYDIVLKKRMHVLTNHKKGAAYVIDSMITCIYYHIYIYIHTYIHTYMCVCIYIYTYI